MIEAIVEGARRDGLSKIVIGDLKGVRKGGEGNCEANSMVHNSWSHGYMIRRLKGKAEEYGIEAVEEHEGKTSSVFPRCMSDWTYKHKRLFKCLNCGLEAHRYIVGVLNIAPLHSGWCPAIGVAALKSPFLGWNGIYGSLKGQRTTNR
ncbi:MAG: zinc ribbon domain-containing protein [Candidatus Methanomethylicaceae archaeon]